MRNMSQNANVHESLNGTPEKYASKDEHYWDSDLRDTEEKDVPWHLLKKSIKYTFEATSDIVKALDINENLLNTIPNLAKTLVRWVCASITAPHPASLFGYVRMAELLDLREDPAD
ncbi:hypothetical protein RU639_003217 [Aspergillus parasiticus]